MKTLLMLCACFILFLPATNAQESVAAGKEYRKYYVKVYGSSYLFGKRHSRLMQEQDISFGGVSLAAGLQSDKAVHELELAYWSWGKRYRYPQSTAEEYSVRYELGTYFASTEKLRLRLGIGLIGVRGEEISWFLWRVSDPYRYRRHLGVALTLIPHIEWSLGKRWLLDLSCSVGNISYVVTKRGIYDPDAAAPYRHTSTIEDVVLGSVWQLRVGVGYKL